MIDATDTALVIEGGGMRNSYTAPAIVRFILEDVNFGWVGGVSAGSAHAVNYASHDAWRAREAFTDFVTNKNFGGFSSLARGRGYFNAEFIYEGSDEDMPFDWESFSTSDVDVHIEALRVDTGHTVTFNRKDITTPERMGKIVRASSTLPKIMPLAFIDEIPFVDGALGDSGGLVIDAAEKAGYEKFLVLATKERDYVRPEVTRPIATRRLFQGHPAIAEALISRPKKYNEAKQRILELEKEGRAKVLFPDAMSVSAGERNLNKLRANYIAGEDQIREEWPSWMEFLSR